MAKPQLKPKIESFMDDVNALGADMIYYIGKERGAVDFPTRSAVRGLRETLREMSSTSVPNYHLLAAAYASLHGNFSESEKHLWAYEAQSGVNLAWFTAWLALYGNSLQAVKLSEIINRYEDVFLDNSSLIKLPGLPLLSGLFQFYLKVMPKLKNLHPEYADSYHAAELAAAILRKHGTSDAKAGQAIDIVGQVLLDAGLCGTSFKPMATFTTDPETVHITYHIKQPLPVLGQLHTELIDRLIDADLDDIGLVIGFSQSHDH